MGRSHTACHRRGSWAGSHPCGEGAHTWEEEEVVGEDHREGMRAFRSHCRGCSMAWREGEGGRGVTVGIS